MTKGIDFYSYLSGGSFGLTFSADDKDFKKYGAQDAGIMQNGHMELDLGIISSGKFGMKAFADSGEIINKTGKIHSPKETLESDDFGNMLRTGSLIGNNHAVSYGFFDAKPGQSCQAYMHVTDNYSSWMGDLVKTYPQIGQDIFGKFALAGSHDAGMFTGHYTPETLKNMVDLIKKHMPLVPAALIASLATDLIMRIVVNLAYTQKDDISTQLKLGVRHFDFRPGYNYPKTGDTLYHQHSFIPGYEFDKFLSDVVSFLKTHPDEIVSVNIKYDGFVDSSMIPSDETVNSAISSALKDSNIQQIGLPQACTTTYNNLIKNNQRLAIQKGNGKCADSYNDSYKTFDVNVIMNAIKNTMNGDLDKDWVILQLQGTYNGTADGAIQAVVSTSDATSPILQTKARFDNNTYPWIVKKENVASKLRNQLLVLLNDFTDNALVSHSIAITKQRHGIL